MEKQREGKQRRERERQKLLPGYYLGSTQVHSEWQNQACVFYGPHGSSPRLENRFSPELRPWPHSTHFICTFLLSIYCFFLLSQLSPAGMKRRKLLWQLSFFEKALNVFGLQLLIPGNALRTPQDSWPYFTSARHSLCPEIEGRKRINGIILLTLF